MSKHEHLLHWLDISSIMIQIRNGLMDVFKTKGIKPSESQRKI